MSRGTLLIKNANLLTMCGSDSSFVGYLLVGPDGRISRLEAGQPPPQISATCVIDAKDRIVMPGFVSAHSHAWQSAFRGIGAGEHVDGWGSAIRRYSVAATDDDLYWFTLHGAIDHLRNGITTLFNFGYAHRPGEYNTHQLAALLDSGARFLHAFALPRTTPIDEHYLSFERYMAFAKEHSCNDFLLAHAITGAGSRMDLAQLGKRLMDDFGVTNQAHYLENPRFSAREREHFANFVATGSMGPAFFFGHFIHTTDAILEQTAAAGSGMSWQPLANGRLGSGVADIPKYLAKGVKVGMGVDGQASADVADPFENMRMGLYALLCKYEDPAVMRPYDILRLHTIGSAEVMGVSEHVGSLAPGKFADFLIVSPSTPVFDAASSVVFASTPENIEAVYVAGQKVADRGKPMNGDWTKIESELFARVYRIIDHCRTN